MLPGAEGGKVRFCPLENLEGGGGGAPASPQFSGTFWVAHRVFIYVLQTGFPCVVYDIVFNIGLLKKSLI